MCPSQQGVSHILGFSSRITLAASASPKQSPMSGEKSQPANLHKNENDRRRRRIT